MAASCSRALVRVAANFTNTSDPVGSGFVTSLAHPGGNVTGFAGAEFSVFGKLLATLKNNDHDVAHGPRRQGLFLADGNGPRKRRQFITLLASAAGIWLAERLRSSRRLSLLSV